LEGEIPAALLDQTRSEFVTDDDDEDGYKVFSSPISSNKTYDNLDNNATLGITLHLKDFPFERKPLKLRKMLKMYFDQNKDNSIFSNIGQTSEVDITIFDAHGDEVDTPKHLNVNTFFLKGEAIYSTFLVFLSF